uniref:Uncharacterized protein n=1 Tax=Anguilla anguilla TaxID=7936 RepID=A0A0E9X539_ANGAN
MRKFSVMVQRYCTVQQGGTLPIRLCGVKFILLVDHVGSHNLHTQSLAATRTVDDGASSLSQYNLSGIHPFKVKDKVSGKRLQNKMN